VRICSTGTKEYVDDILTLLADKPITIADYLIICSDAAEMTVLWRMG